MSALTNERGYIGGAGVGLQRRLDAMLAMGDDLDAVGRQELTALVVTRHRAVGDGPAAGSGARAC